jgi:hypothetical protein
MPNASGTRWVQVIKLRARSMFRRAAVERDLARELQSHIDLQVEDYVTRGMSPIRRGRQLSGSLVASRDSRTTSATRGMRRSLVTSVAICATPGAGLSRRPLLLVVSILSIGLGVAGQHHGVRARKDALSRAAERAGRGPTRQHTLGSE